MGKNISEDGHSDWMREEEGEFLRERAEKFLKVGERLLKEGVLDLAAFHFHQAAELILKYALFRRTGDYPRTHSIRRLLKLLSKSTEDEGIMTSSGRTSTPCPTWRTPT